MQKSPHEVNVVKWTVEDIEFLCPSLPKETCHAVLETVKYRVFAKVNDYAWEQLELALAQMGLEVEGKKCEECGCSHW